jgi:hypothetical protein
MGSKRISALVIMIKSVMTSFLTPVQKFEPETIGNNAILPFPNFVTFLDKK